MLRRHCILTIVALAALTSPAHAENTVRWQAWTNAAFDTARAEKKFVILDLAAVWCHWCHVMEDTTYTDPAVVALLQKQYITIRADQDANPDLSARYGDWGWPATIIFAPDGAELVKRRGYIPPENMASLLQAVIDDPTPGPSVSADVELTPASTAALSLEQRQALTTHFDESYDAANAGWGTGHKFIDPDSMDWALLTAERGDAKAKMMAVSTLDHALTLIDPAWGGLYQYSDADDWRSPHFEKIMWYQANGLRQYSLAYTLFKDPKYLNAAHDLSRYLTTFLLGPDGAFFATQDADVDNTLTGKDFYALNDQERRKLGRRPHIDQNLYARENGWAISALTALSNATGETIALQNATRAADWVIANRRNTNGTFRHGDHDRGGPFLGDTIAMANAELDLYAATGDRKWLDLARETCTALAMFRNVSGGFSTSLTAEGEANSLAKAFKASDEQVQAARLAARLWRYLGTQAAKDMAEHAMKYLASQAMIESGRVTPGILLADNELRQEPTHITIVGHKDDMNAIQLHDAARRYPAVIKRIDWWDMREGSLSNPDVTYPDMGQAAAFACSNRLCSQPAFSAADLTSVVTQMLAHSAQ